MMGIYGWVLILTLVGSDYGWSAGGVAMQPFPSQITCEQAGERWLRMFDIKVEKNAARRLDNSFYTCVKK